MVDNKVEDNLLFHKTELTISMLGSFYMHRPVLKHK